MSERRFTKFKASLSKETAAKTRETVSRELRQSLSKTNANAITSNSNSISPDGLVSCIETDYERSLRQWNKELRLLLLQQLENNIDGTLKEEKKVDVNEMDGKEEYEEGKCIKPTDLDLLNYFTISDDDIQVQIM